MKHILIIFTIVSLFSCNDSIEINHQNNFDSESTVANVEQVDNRIHIRGLGDYNSKDLKNISKYIQDFYKYECIIDSSVNTDKNMYLNNTDTLDVDKCIYELKRPKIKTIYVTDEVLVLNRQKIRGGVKLRSNTIIISSTKHNRETVIHEIGHTLGLKHCDNIYCVMAIKNDEYDTEDFCDKCKKILKNNENL